MRRLAVFLAPLSAIVLFGSPALAANQVAPGQAFTGRVNGSFSHATVIVICPGPARTGHPAAGQTLEVLSPLPPVVAGTTISVGQTGTLGRAIVARFSDDRSQATTFHDYFVDLPIPTTLVLPCTGTGRVAFRPAPFGPGARTSVVSVTYVSLTVVPPVPLGAT